VDFLKGWGSHVRLAPFCMFKISDNEKSNFMKDREIRQEETSTSK
jgi:hypothetical protein